MMKTEKHAVKVAHARCERLAAELVQAQRDLAKAQADLERAWMRDYIAKLVRKAGR